MGTSMIAEDLLLSWGATYKKVLKGEVIFHEGCNGKYYHQLVQGKVKWMNVDDSGREFIQDIIDEGQSFGEFPLLDGGPYVATSVADEDSLLFRLPKEIFLQLLRENPVIHFSFTRLMTERLRHKFIILKELASQDPERKVNTILQWYKKAHAEKGDDKLKIRLTRQEIADMTGLRVETVIRTIRSLHDRGSLSIEKGKVYC